jgi:hypothetical protein
MRRFSKALALLDRPNILLADELFLLSIDWPVARLVKAVNGVITTWSTLAIDAVAAGKPIVLLPSIARHAGDTAAFLPASVPWHKDSHRIRVLAPDEWASGQLPEELRGDVTGYIAPTEEWFTPSWMSLARLAEVGKGPQLQGLKVAERILAGALAQAARWHSLDFNPHRDRHRLTMSLTRFLG